MRTAFEREGDVRSVDLLGAFATLWRDAASGVVEFSSSGRTVRFDVSDGELVRVSSSDESVATAEILRRAEKLSAEALAAGRIPPGSDGARYLRDIGLLSDRDWRWGEKLRIVEILSDLVSWLDGTYRYDSTAAPEGSDFQIGIHRVILELYLRSSDLAFIHHSLGAPDAALVRAADFDEKFSSLGLTQDALVVAEAIDGSSTAAEISERTPPDPFSVEKLLAALATLGLVHPEYAREAPREAERLPPPPPTREPEPPEALEEAVEEEPEPVEETALSAVPDTTPAPEPAVEPEADLELLEMPVPESTEKEGPVVELWERAPAEPLDQPLDVVEAPDFGASRRSGLSRIWLPLLLAAGVGALLLLRSREPSADSTPIRVGTRAAASPPATAEPSFPTAAPALPVIPTAVPATPVIPTAVPATAVIPTAVPATAVIPTAVPATPAVRPTFPPTVAPPSPRPTRVPPTPKPPSPRPTPAVSDARRTRDAWLALADRDRRRLVLEPRRRFSIQLELVCELPSLEEAWVFDRQDAMWLLTAPFQGRTCFRVFWGRYETAEEAQAGMATVPRFFFTPTNRPVVVSTSGALLR
ncbi:MAG TPA: hypothetical protein VNC59_09165 [Thermoanaerobaculia bacterium]|nr:hypothetical protein [Thermoanaerobaculia bacterium]